MPLQRLVLVVAILMVAAATQSRAQVARPGLSEGVWVRIDGEAGETGTLVARRVRLQDPLSKPLLRGRVQAAAQGGRRVTILSMEVATDAGTTLYRGESKQPASFGELVPGVVVEAKVVRRGKRLVATRIRIEDGHPEDATASIDAPVDRVDVAAGRFFVLGTPFPLQAVDQIVDERSEGTAAEAPADGLRRDEDDQSVKPIQVGDTLTIGGRLETTLQDRSDYDLSEARPDRNERVDSRVQLLATAALTSTVEAYAKVSSSRRFPVFDRRGPAPGGGDVRVEEAYVTIHEPAGLRLTAQVGRQRFRDRREWFFDEYLDAVRVRTDVSRWSLEVAFARGLFRPEDQDDREERDARHVIASAATRVGTATLHAFLINRRGDVSGAAPTWIGADVSGHFTPEGKYWSALAIRRGRAGDLRLRGWALDAGTTWQLPVRFTPSVTFAIATATGDRRRDDNVDDAFHQTDLNDNKARFGGLKRFAYYGEALRPELSDVSILTLGTSATPWRRFSLDVVYHRYYRRSSGAWAADTDLRPTADGRDSFLGDEVDAILASQAIRGIDLSLVVGVFRPGAAYPEGQAPAVIWKPQIRFYF